MSSDDAITEEGHAGKSHSITHIKESIDWKTGGLDLRKTGFSGSSSDFAASPSSRKAKEQNHGDIAVGSSAGNEKSPCVEKENNTRKIHQDTFHLKHDGVVTDPTGQSVSINEARENSRALKNTSNVQTTAVKKTTAEDKTSRAIMDDVSF